MNPDPSPADDPDHGLDVDARFAEIVAGWGQTRPELDEATPAVPDAPAPDAPAPDAPGTDDRAADRAGDDRTAEPALPEAPPADRLRGLFQPLWSDPLDDDATWEDEGHFVPPPPPPLPSVEPHRRLGWAGLIGTPLVALLLIGAGIRVTGWLAFLLVLTFVGGFGYLVATMRSGPPDDWSGDDGARI